MNRPPLYVTRPILPPLEEMLPLVQEIWRSHILTNGGPILQRFEKALCGYLGAEHISIVSNGSMGLVLSLKHFGITGEVVTSPFSFVATTHAIRWVGAEPVFADIDPVSLNLDPEQVEKHITPRTEAILAVHCYGVPCNIDLLSDIARRYGLKLIFDAAHAFGVSRGGNSLCNAGDLSVLSFHATKVFNTFEGGAIIAPDQKTKLALDRLGNFGIVDEITVLDVGLNAKMSEINAAVGLALLPHMDAAIAARGKIAQRYLEALSGVVGLHCVCSAQNGNHNYYAFPLLVGDEYPLTRDELYRRLQEENIFARRYFFPLISNLPMYRELPSAHQANLKVANRVSAQVLCLPMFPGLPDADLDRIIDIVQTP